MRKKIQYLKIGPNVLQFPITYRHPGNYHHCPEELRLMELQLRGLLLKEVISVLKDIAWLK